LYAAGYAVLTVIFGWGASKTSGVVSAVLMVVTVLLGAAAIWTTAFMGGVLLLIEWAKRKVRTRD
jgi:hypothetical protein